MYEVAKLSSVSVSCTMDANPDSEIYFKWQFNTSGHTVNIPVCYYQGRVTFFKTPAQLKTPSKTGGVYMKITLHHTTHPTLSHSSPDLKR